MINSKEQRESYLVAYDPKHQSAVEIWDVDGSLVAEMPWGETHVGAMANDILKTAVEAERIDIRQVEQ